MEEALQRGFTTLRDLGGADHGLVRGVEDGLIDGPRLVICGKGLTTTGGHADLRSRTDDRPGMMSDRLGSMGLIADGVDEVRAACRTMIKEGAKFIKVMANGGVSSPNDPIHSIQYSREEILAMVEEAENAGMYVSAHVYTDKAIRRCVELGVHSLEHCNLITSETAELAAERGCIAVPTLVAYEGLWLDGEALGLGQGRVRQDRRGALRRARIARHHARRRPAHGLRLGPFGTAAQISLHGIRASGQGADPGRDHPLGNHRSAPGSAAWKARSAPFPRVPSPTFWWWMAIRLADITLLQDDGAHMPLIMRGGTMFKNQMA